MNLPVLELLYNLRHRSAKGFAVLIDPDKADPAQLERLVHRAEGAGASILLVGGSLLTRAGSASTLAFLRRTTRLPVVLFPGSVSQVQPEADAILFLSLISGRNADLLIGRHVEAAPLLRDTALEVIPTGYMLVDCGEVTTAHYVSNTLPLPYEKADLAACTALAGQLLGLRLLYLDGGSGAKRHVSAEMIGAVRHETELPIVVGGGIRSVGAAREIWEAGADLIVVGNALESGDENDLLESLGQALKKRSIEIKGTI